MRSSEKTGQYICNQYEKKKRKKKEGFIFSVENFVVLFLRGYPHGVMVKAMDCGIVVSEFILQSRYYVHFRANTLGKGMSPLYSQQWVK